MPADYFYYYRKKPYVLDPHLQPILSLCHVVICLFFNCFIYVLFIMHTCMSVHIPYVWVLPEMRRQCWIPLNWIYRQLCITLGGLNLHKFK